MGELKEQEEEARAESFRQARVTMGQELLRDEGLYIGYRANVAMLLHDRYGIRDHETRNKAARDILNLIFELRKS